MSRGAVMVGAAAGFLLLPVVVATLLLAGVGAAVVAVVAAGVVGAVFGGVSSPDRERCHECGTDNDADRMVCVECRAPL